MPLLPLLLLSAAPGDPAPAYADRWFYAQQNLQVEKNADELVALIGRAAKAGYTGVVLADYKLNILERVPAHYFRHAAKVKAAADAAKVEIIPCVASFGYSSGILAHDPNLAEGLPVRRAPYSVSNGVAWPAGYVSLRNGGFEDGDAKKLSGLGFQDAGAVADDAVAATGKRSLRFEGASGNVRVSQKVSVRPWASYRLRAKVRTAGFRPNGEFKLLALGAGGRALTHHDAHLKSDQDWTPTAVVFNSLDSTEVNVYVGSWGSHAGAVWVDDWALEEVGPLNVLRRAGCPLNVTNADGTTAYEEARDFEPLRDPKLGQVPYAGEYGFTHDAPQLRLTPGSRIGEGELLHVSWYHPVAVHGNQVACSLSEPKVFEIVRDQVKRVNELFRPRTWFLSHDEIRVTGWDRDAESSGLSPGKRLAANVRQCAEIVRGASPGCRVVVWSDMFDPHHNARNDYYLVNGDLAGSWEGLDRDVMIANWNGGKAAESLRFFAGRGHKQVIAGYYDAGSLERGFGRWDAAARGVEGVTGYMYTTWQRRYDKLEEYGRAVRRE